MVKNPPANAGDERDEGSIPELERSLEEGMATHSSVLAWRIPMDRGALVGYSPQGRKELDMTEQLSVSQRSLPFISCQTVLPVLQSS